MQCERCKAILTEGEERELHGQMLCEDCYMDLLSPAKACDPWAVHSAKTFLEELGHEPQLNQIQQKILEMLRDQGPIEPGNLSERLQVKEADIEREIATLRHMEKVRGELRYGKRLVRLWD
jgi:predicted HTH transcriptional regulator